MMRFGSAKPKINMYTVYEELFGSSHDGAQLNKNHYLTKIILIVTRKVYFIYLN